ncbi:MAG: ATP-dependent RNA helicase RhlB [Desulfatitalea sp.]|nr:ATP-dependent RNA helicase RhlB [Desulfatitalea sp.]NNK01687.1 ATP-dependent RNA helicase RhlB [Desulfatitalea sp.]
MPARALHVENQVPQSRADQCVIDKSPPRDRDAGQKTGISRKGPHDDRSPKSIDKKQQAPKWDPADYQVPPADGKVRFHDLNLPNTLMRAIADLGFQYCTPIQAEILPSTLAGKDATGRAQTGTGKTAAFLITVITHLLRHTRTGKRRKGAPRVLVLGPTRELVMQIADEARQLTKYTNLTTVSVFGGMDYEKQRRQLAGSKGDIVVATPGRLLDFKRQGDVHLDEVEIMIIDEADRMLDMGFIPDVRKIIYATPHKSKRQTLLFSATLTLEVTRLSAQWTKDPVSVEIEPEQVAVDSVEQLVYIVTREEKYAMLYNIITKKNLERVIVFCNRKDETRRLADLFTRYCIDCAVLSGDVRQRTRIRTLDDFKAGKIRILVATDVAGRGIHIEGMDHVINYTLPRDPEDYVHRIGRTGRAGAAGTSISFADEEDSFFIPKIETLIGNKLPCIQPEDEWLADIPKPPPAKHVKPAERDGGQRASSGRRGGRRGSRSGGAHGSGRRSSNQGQPRRRPRKS